MNITKITPTGKEATCVVSDALFAAKVNQPLISQAIRVYLANQRQGTSAVQSRSDVNRTKAKIYRQKGTGKARHGSRNAPIFVGGGVAHGPSGVQNWSLVLSKKQKQVAMISALSLQSKQTLVSDIPLETSGKTKYAARFLKTINPDLRKCLLILHKDTEPTRRSFTNIPCVTIRSVAKLNVLDVMSADLLVFTSQAISDLETRLLANDNSEKPQKSTVLETKTPTAVEKKVVKKAEKPLVKKTTKKAEVKKVEVKKATKITKKVAK